MDRPRAPLIAIATATVAVLFSLIALVVVATRSKAPAASELVPFETAAAASDVVRLRRDAVEVAKDDAGMFGVRVTDETLRTALGLQAFDVITAIAGHTIKTEADVEEALSGVRFSNATTIYVDLVREGEPVVVRWKLDDTLRSVRRSDRDDLRPRNDRDALLRPRIPRPDPPSNPFDDPDPVVDTIKQLDPLHYEIPRTTVEQILMDPMAMSRGVRVVPAMSMGRTEGYKLYAIRPSSVYAKLGFSNGDLIREINGFALDGPDKLLEIYTKLRDATSLEIALTRRGRDETLRIDIR